jgi:beta-fructofuranosidase
MFYFAPGKSVCADVIPYYENGTYYLFYLRDYRDIKEKGEGCPWCLLTTNDLVHYVDHGPVLLRGSEKDQDLYVFTGSVFKDKGRYYIFYTGHNPHFIEKGKPQEKILMATSDDLFHWEKARGFSLKAPSFLEPHDFRDPFVFKNEKTGEYCMLLAAREKSSKPLNRRGITALATSNDLLHWRVRKKPFYAPDAFYTHECPDLFKMGRYWYLAFSEFTDKVVTTYRVSNSQFGPWRKLKQDTYDGHAFYAAKGTSDGKRRIVFGWDPIKLGYDDNAPWQWGGAIIPHELVQDPRDGTLYVKCPKEILDSYSKRVGPEKPSVLVGKARETPNGLALWKRGFSLVDLGKHGKNCRIAYDFQFGEKTGEFGVYLKANKDYSQYYAVKFEPGMNRLGFDRLPRSASYTHTEVDVERHCDLSSNKKHHMEIILEGSVLAVFVDDKYAMCGRCFKDDGNRLALFSQDEKVSFANIAVYESGGAKSDA